MEEAWRNDMRGRDVKLAAETQPLRSLDLLYRALMRAPISTCLNGHSEPATSSTVSSSKRFVVDQR